MYFLQHKDGLAMAKLRNAKIQVLGQFKVLRFRGRQL